MKNKILIIAIITIAVILIGIATIVAYKNRQATKINVSNVDVNKTTTTQTTNTVAVPSPAIPATPSPASPTPTSPPPPAPPKTPPTTPPTSVNKIFNLTGSNFTFSLQEIKVKKGDQVTINFMSAEGYHDWSLDEFNARTQRVQADGKTSVTFTADKTGIFEYYCSVGSHHALGMVGKLIVE